MEVDGSVVTFICYGGLGDFDVLVNEERISSLYFDDKILSADGPPSKSFDVSRSETKPRVTMFPVANATPTDSVNYRVVTATCDASVTLRITDDPDAALTMARVIVRPESAREADERRREEERQRKIERSTPMADLSPPVILPDKERVVTTGGPVFLDIAHGWFEQSELFLAFDALNDGAPSRRIAQVLAYDRSGEPLPIDVSHIQNAGPADENVLASVPGKSRARGFISLPGAANGDIRGLTIMLLGDDGSTLATASVGDWDSRRQILVPMSDEEIERQKQNEEAKGRLSLQVHALGGYIWLNDGLEGSRLDATDLRGLGIRGSYGINRLLMLTVEVAGASSGTARFDGISVGDAEGELLRTTKLGRVLVSGQVNMGHRIMPYVRLGVGFQGAGYDSELMTSNGPVPGADESFEIDGMWAVGGGIEFRLWRQLMAGGGFAYFGLEDSEQRLLELGVHFGYSWKP